MTRETPRAFVWMVLLALPAAAGLLALSATPASAQVTGALTVQVVDDDGPLPGATVTVSNTERRIKTVTYQTEGTDPVHLPVLPVGGMYVIEVSFPGYGTQRREVKVKPAETIGVTVHLASEVVEKVKVVGEREVVDLEDTSHRTKFSDDFIADLPVPGNSYQSVLTLAPGVQDANNDGQPTVHGSRSRDFKVMVAGVSNVDPLTGRLGAEINMDSIDSMEVITTGAGAAYGRAQGGFANIVKKQGSNSFEGVFSFRFLSSAIDGDGAADWPSRFLPEFRELRPSAQISGPLVKDRLWYRLSFDYRDIELPVNTIGSIELSTVKEEINSHLVTWQVSDRNKLAFSWDENPATADNFGISSLTPPESSRLIKWDRDTYTVEWSAPYSPQLFINTVAAWQDWGLSDLPSSSGSNNDCLNGPAWLEGAYCFNAETGKVSGSYFRDWVDERQRFTLKSDAKLFVKNKFLGMSHELGFGFDVQNERYTRELFRRPRITFFIFRPSGEQPGGAPLNFDPVGVIVANLTVPQAARDRALGTTWGAYFEDSMKPLSNLTIKIGARVDRETTASDGLSALDPLAEFARYLDVLGDHSGATVGDFQRARVAAFSSFKEYEALREQVVSIIGAQASQVGFGPLHVQAQFQKLFRQLNDIHLTNTNFSPHLAVGWDPWKNGKTKLAASVGRYYNNIFLRLPTEELAPVSTTLRLDAQRRQGSWVVNDVTQREPLNPAAAVTLVDRNLQTPYQDEYSLEFSRQLWAETSISVQLVRREYRDQFQDIDINHVPGDFGTCVHVTQPGQSPIDPTRLDGVIDDCRGDYLLPPGATEDPPPFEGSNLIERPDGIPDLYTMNPFWGPIYVIGNYNRADYEAVVLELVRRQYRGWELNGSYTWSEAVGNGEDYLQQLGDDQSNLDDEFGHQSTDQRHVVKLNATTITPWGVRLGGSVTWQSGLPYSLLLRRFAIDALPPAFGGFGSAEPRTRLQYPTGQRNDQRNSSFWDFRLRAAREFRLRGGINLQLAVQILNLLNDGTYRVYSDFAEQGWQINGNNEATRRFGRRFEFSMKMSF